MNRKGFTLVELLAVIIILGIITTITIYSVSDILNDSKNSLSETQIKKVEEAAKVYYLKEGMSDNDSCVSINKLISNGYIESKEVKDPKTKKEIDGYVKITYESNHYIYKYQENSCE